MDACPPAVTWLPTGSHVAPGTTPAPHPDPGLDRKGTTMSSAPTLTSSARPAPDVGPRPEQHARPPAAAGPVGRRPRRSPGSRRCSTRHSITALRISLGLVFLGFGVLKFFPGMSPAAELAERTIGTLTFGLVGPTAALLLTAIMETVIGLTLVTGLFLRTGLVILAGRAGRHHVAAGALLRRAVPGRRADPDGSVRAEGRRARVRGCGHRCRGARCAPAPARVSPSVLHEDVGARLAPAARGGRGGPRTTRRRAGSSSTATRAVDVGAAQLVAGSSPGWTVTTHSWSPGRPTAA